MDTGRFFDAEEALAHVGAGAAGADAALEAEDEPDFAMVMINGPSYVFVSSSSYSSVFGQTLLRCTVHIHHTHMLLRRQYWFLFFEWV